MNLTDHELDALQIILGNEAILVVLHKVFDLTVEFNRPVITEDDDNLKLGEKYRAFELSKQILAHCFTNLEKLKRDSTVEKLKNRAL